METIFVKHNQWKVIKRILARSGKSNRHAYKELIIWDKEIHATDGRILMRINKESRLEDNLDNGSYEVLKVEKDGLVFTEITINKTETVTPNVSHITNSKIVSSNPSVNIHIGKGLNDHTSLTKAILVLFDNFKEAYDYESIFVFAPLNSDFKATHQDSGGMLRLESFEVLCLVMPFKLK